MKKSTIFQIKAFIITIFALLIGGLIVIELIKIFFNLLLILFKI